MIFGDILRPNIRGHANGASLRRVSILIEPVTFHDIASAIELSSAISLTHHRSILTLPIPGRNHQCHDPFFDLPADPFLMGSAGRSKKGYGHKPFPDLFNTGSLKVDPLQYFLSEASTYWTSKTLQIWVRLVVCHQVRKKRFITCQFAGLSVTPTFMLERRVRLQRPFCRARYVSGVRARAYRSPGAMCVRPSACGLLAVGGSDK